MSAQKAAITSLCSLPPNSPQLPQLAMQTRSGWLAPSRIAMCASCWMRGALSCPCDQSVKSKCANGLGCSPFTKGSPEGAEASIASCSWDPLNLFALGNMVEIGFLPFAKACLPFIKVFLPFVKAVFLLSRFFAFCQGFLPFVKVFLPFVKVLQDCVPFAKGSLALSQKQQHTRGNKRFQSKN